MSPRCPPEPLVLSTRIPERVRSVDFISPRHGVARIARPAAETGPRTARPCQNYKPLDRENIARDQRRRPLQRGEMDGRSATVAVGVVVEIPGRRVVDDAV